MNFLPFKRLAFAVFALSIAVSAHAQTLVREVPTPAPVEQLVQTEAGAYIETESGSYRLEGGACLDTGFCLIEEPIRGLPEPAPKDALPDGKIATSNTGDIRKAWYAHPTMRYQHCVLGDCIEGGSLVVELADGSQKEFILPRSQVFEDITPRIWRNRVVTIRASQHGGAAVVVYGLRNNRLVEIAASAENGQRNRWLNIAAIDDFEQTIHFVRTPHIGGRWSTLTIKHEEIHTCDDIRTGFSNHVIGARELSLSAALLSNKHTSVYIPSQDRRSLIDVLGVRPDIELPEAIDKIILLHSFSMLAVTESGALLRIDPELKFPLQEPISHPYC